MLFAKKRLPVLSFAAVLVICSFGCAPNLFTTAEKSAALKPKSAFSFIVLGDNRLPGYLRFTEDQKDSLNKFIKNNYTGYALKKTKYEDTGYLSEMTLCSPKNPKKCKDFTLKDGWPEKIIDSSKKPSLSLIGEGQTWVYDSIIRDAAAMTDKNVLVLHTGDIVYNGYYNGSDPTQSPYWKRFRDNLLNRLPSGAPKGLPGRFFPTLGNHETWLDPEIKGILASIEYLEKSGLSSDDHMYHFKMDRNLFIFLDTGGYKPPAGWGEDSIPSYENQMARLKTLLNQAKDKRNIDNVFVLLHKPPFVASGHGHLSAEKNPHDTLKLYSHNFDITVFSGHVHSTEAYLKENIKYFVLGGGGADQAFKKNCEPGDPYCQGESYWKGADRVLEYNYMTVTIGGDQPGYTLSRWRPMDKTTPYADCQFSIAEKKLLYNCNSVQE